MGDFLHDMRWISIANRESQNLRYTSSPPNAEYSVPTTVFQLQENTIKMHIYIHTHTHIYIYMFVVIKFDALAEASHFRIQRTQVAFLWWDQDSNSGDCWTHPCRLNAPSQTNWAIQHQAKSLNSIARPHGERVFSPRHTTTGRLSQLAL